MSNDRKMMSVPVASIMAAARVIIEMGKTSDFLAKAEKGGYTMDIPVELKEFVTDYIGENMGPQPLGTKSRTLAAQVARCTDTFDC